MIFDYLNRICIYEGMIPELRDVARELKREDFLARPDAAYHTEGGTGYFLQTFQSDPHRDSYEVHDRFIDVQIVLSGREVMKCISYRDELPQGFSTDNDFGSFSAENPESSFLLTPGRFALVFPGEPHMPGLSAGDRPETVRKAVFKIPSAKP